MKDKKSFKQLLKKFGYYKNYQFALNGPSYPFWTFWFKLLKSGINPFNWSTKHRANPIKLKWILFNIKTMLKFSDRY